MLFSFFKKIGPFVYRIRRPGVWKEYKRLKNIYKCSFRELMDSQERHLDNLISFAKQNVPFYEKAFNIHEIKNFSDWTNIPILNKSNLRNSGKELRAVNASSTDYRVNKSGGSTGTPVEFLSDYTQFDFMDANLMYMFTWAGWKPGEMTIYFWGGLDTDLDMALGKKIRTLLSGRLLVSSYTLNEKVMERWAAFIAEFRPTILYGYPSVLARLARYIATQELGLDFIKGVFVTAETLLPEHRNIIEKVFSCKVYNQYGSREVPCISCECEKGKMHIFTEHNKVEVLDDFNNEASHGRLIVTPLHARSQPLLRYEIGDVGSLEAGGVCECGRPLPIMGLDVGRTREQLTAIDGSSIYPNFITSLMYGHEWVESFQFRQTEKNVVVLSLVPETKKDLESKVTDLGENIEPRFHKLLGSEMRLEIKLVEFIEKTKLGKNNYIINDLEGYH